MIEVKGKQEQLLDLKENTALLFALTGSHVRLRIGSLQNRTRIMFMG